MESFRDDPGGWHVKTSMFAFYSLNFVPWGTVWHCVSRCSSTEFTETKKMTMMSVCQACFSSTFCNNIWAKIEVFVQTLYSVNQTRLFTGWIFASCSLCCVLNFLWDFMLKKENNNKLASIQAPGLTLGHSYNVWISCDSCGIFQHQNSWCTAWRLLDLPHAEVIQHRKVGCSFITAGCVKYSIQTLVLVLDWLSHINCLNKGKLKMAHTLTAPG